MGHSNVRMEVTVTIKVASCSYKFLKMNLSQTSRNAPTLEDELDLLFQVSE